MRTVVAVAALVLVSSVTLRAQEAPAPSPDAVTEAESAEEQAHPRRHIQVLEHPYDISSFYRSSQESGPVDLGYEPEGARSRYPIASFYRSGAQGRYSMFWTSGYGYGRSDMGASRARGRGLIGARRPRALGLNGDLCLFAPTFLASVGPLTGVFFER
jgi:hypothetical protein